MTIDIRIDFERRDRIGLFEAIWGEDKSIDQLIRVVQEVREKKEVVFITRINKDKANHLLKLFKDAKYFEEANCITIGANLDKISYKKRLQ